MSTLKVSSVIRFSAGAGDGSGGGDDETDPRVDLSLTTRLDGLSAITAPSKTGRYATLLIQFAPSDLCERLRFLGISPEGHADLILPNASYRGSSLGYSGPSSALYPLWLYSDDSDAALLIGFPESNLFDYFQWPVGVFGFDPPLTHQTPPEQAIEVARFESYSEPLDPADRGVRLPMRLIAIRVSQTGETVIATMNYEDAPVFTASSDSVTCKLATTIVDPPSDDAMFKVTGAQLAQALQVGAEDRADLYLRWRIYKGSGVMVYRALCNGDPIDGEYNDQRNAGIGGGFGTFETTDLLAAQIRLEPPPLPFWVQQGSIGLDWMVGTDGATRAIEGPNAPWSRAWREGESVEQILNIDGQNIGMGGETWWTMPVTILAACIAEERHPHSPSGQSVPRKVIRVFGSNHVLYHIELCTGVARVVGTVPSRPSFLHSALLEGGQVVRPSYRQYPDPLGASFSQDGLSLIWYARPLFSDADLRQNYYPGAIWTLTLTPEDVDGETILHAGEWALIYTDPDGWSGNPPNPDDFATITVEGSGVCAGDSYEYQVGQIDADQSIEVLAWAGYVGNDIAMKTVKLRKLYSASKGLNEILDVDENGCPLIFLDSVSETNYLFSFIDTIGSAKTELVLTKDCLKIEEYHQCVNQSLSYNEEIKINQKQFVFRMIVDKPETLPVQLYSSDIYEHVGYDENGNSFVYGDGFINTEKTAKVFRTETNAFAQIPYSFSFNEFKKLNILSQTNGVYREKIKFSEYFSDLFDSYWGSLLSTRHSSGLWMVRMQLEPDGSAVLEFSSGHSINLNAALVTAIAPISRRIYSTPDPTP